MRIPMAWRLAAAAFNALLALYFGGVALMLWAATGVTHWLLWAVPLAPLGVGALILMWPLAQRDSFGLAASVKRQVERDIALVRDIC